MKMEQVIMAEVIIAQAIMAQMKKKAKMAH